VQPLTSDVDRRDVGRRNQLLQRLHAEFREMPGIALSGPQIARLENLPVDVCDRVLNELLHRGDVSKRDDGRFIVAQPRPEDRDGGKSV